MTTLQLSRHAEARMRERGIDLDHAIAAYRDPDLTYGSRNQRGPVRIFEGGDVRVVVGENDIVVTVTWKDGDR